MKWARGASLFDWMVLLGLSTVLLGHYGISTAREFVRLLETGRPRAMPRVRLDYRPVHLPRESHSDFGEARVIQIERESSTRYGRPFDIRRGPCGAQTSHMEWRFDCDL